LDVNGLLDLLVNSNFMQLRQLLPIRESEFIRFSKERGISLQGIIEGEPSQYVASGWLAPDMVANDRTFFHPFRFYLLHTVKKVTAEGMTTKIASKCNRILDLAVVLEPIYWPEITNKQSQPAHISDEVFTELFQNYKLRLLELVKSLDIDEWKTHHNNLRIDASKLDSNADLYILLRLSKWEKRQKLKGVVSGALWLRHIAEMIRLAFAEAHSGNDSYIEWKEEDEAFGYWPENSRRSFYGSNRPLDNLLECRRHICKSYGLTSGSLARWYVEGETEFFAVLTAIPRPQNHNFELVNLKGCISQNKGNTALSLEELIEDDASHERLSIISFDTDVGANIKIIRRIMSKPSFVGYVQANSPDFEFQNFTVTELVSIAKIIDKEAGHRIDSFDTADWSDVRDGAGFEEKYREVSLSKTKLKGKVWGHSLANYAIRNPTIGDTQTQRPFLKALHAATSARTSNYIYFKENYFCDPKDFEIKCKS